MSFIPFRRKKASEGVELQSQLSLAKSGDALARNELLRDYIPFIAKSASKAVGRYVRRGQDDEFSVALAAFNEAIDRYEADRGVNFFGFADTVIKRRLIDHYRSKTSRERDVPLSQFEVMDEEDNVINYVEVECSINAYVVDQEQVERQGEIEEYSKFLAFFNIQFRELVSLSPKHADARLHAVEVARLIAEDELLKQYLIEKRALPLKELSQRVSVSRKTLERQRKYIIAIALVYIGEFPMLRHYLE